MRRLVKEFRLLLIFNEKQFFLKIIVAFSKGYAYT